MRACYNLLLLDRRKTAAMALTGTAIAGMILLVSFLIPSSEPEVQFIFGLSQFRIIIGLFFLMLVLANSGVAFLLMVQRWPWQEAFDSRATALVSENLVRVLWPFYVVALTTAALLLLTTPPLAPSLKFLEPVGARLISPIAWLFLVSTLSIVLIRFLRAQGVRERESLLRLDYTLLAVGIFLLIFVSYEHIAAWIGWVDKSRYSYWNWLAQAFLEGKLYLQDPPQTHDLTLYHGRWYVPSPPVPAVMMLPLVYLTGAENIHSGDLSMFFGALNGVLLFVILHQLIRRQWLKLAPGGALWLVALFAFGTPHLWVGISGRVWFVSQILTLTFLALATLAVLKSWSPWIVGISLGLAVGTRPNSLMTWPFLFAAAMQILKEGKGRLDFRQLLIWSGKSILPVAIAVAGLLLYNHSRFDDALDFGYTTINGDPEVVRNAQTYGLFSTHFIPYNLRVMFLYLPEIRWGHRWPILPSGAGMSMFLATPPLVYLFHRYEPKWWIVGAWMSVFLNFLLLASYHNSGRDQFGYRYILDALLPLVAMLAVTFGKKVPWHFIVLVLLSIAINIYGADWFMNG